MLTPHTQIRPSAEQAFAYSRTLCLLHSEQPLLWNTAAIVTKVPRFSNIELCLQAALAFRHQAEGYLLLFAVVYNAKTGIQPANRSAVT